ncbi:hypothetical protein SFRURICE_000432 [Spodoptera frugiperda]|nr:hypothetical protein SFRURICE_000432 [Spodoptera frugiperda]
MSEGGLSEEEAQQLARETVEREIADKSAELQALLDLQEVGFTPRSALARTPPQGFSTPLGTLDYAEGRATAAAAAAGATAGKRGLTSPGEVQEAVRRRIAAVRMGRKEVPPMGGIQLRAARSPSPPCSEQGAEEEAPTENWVGPADPVTSAPVEQLAGLATASTKGIMEAVRGKTSKLNKDEIAAIGAHTERLGAVVTHLLLRLATAEREPAVAREKGRENLNQEAPRHIPPAGGPVRSFANTLRLGRDNAPVPIMRPPGPAVVIFPAEDQKERLKTAEDTRRALRTAVQPAKLGIQIAGLRKVGNAGVVVQTTSAAAAERLRKAVPDTLRATEPAARQPLIALTGIDKGATLEDVIADIKEQNLREEEWTKEKIGGALRVTGLSEEEAQQLAQETVAREIADKSAELQALLDLQEVGFTPRSALARTPPQGFSTPLGTMEYAEGRVAAAAAAAAAGATAGKRGLSSPEEVQEAVRRRIAAVRVGRKEVPPMGGIQLRAARSPSPPCSEQGAEEGAPTEKWVGPADPVTSAPVEQLAGLATASTKGIMEAVRGKTSKLNKDEIAAIGAHTERLGAVVTHLLLRLAAAERRAADSAGRVLLGGEERLRQQEAAPAAPRSFASALKLGRGAAPVPIAGREGPVLVIRPAEEHRDKLKTADDTRAVLKKSVDPAKLGLQIVGVRRTGNAGVVVHTRSEEAAASIRRAIPPTLKVSTPAERRPLVALTGRPLASPEEQPIPTRRRVGRGDDLPPVSGIMSDAPAAATTSCVPDTGAPGVVRAGASTLSAETAEGLTTIATNATRGIMDAVRSRTSKLNKEEIASIGGHTERLSAVIAHMAVRLAAAEAKIAMGAAQGALAQTSSPPSVAARSYAGALKMPNGKPPMPVQHQGPAVIFYPTAAEVKTSKETKRILQEAVKPSEVGIRVTQVRKVGNSGVVVRTATAEAAAKLRSAVPAGLRAVEPKSRLPRVALRYLRSDVSGDTIVEELHRINLAEDAAWPLARFKQECKLAVKKQLVARRDWQKSKRTNSSNLETLHEELRALRGRYKSAMRTAEIDFFRLIAESDVAIRQYEWIQPDHFVSQILTGHDCFRKRLHKMKLCGSPVCPCGEEEESRDHALWECSLYAEERSKMLDAIRVAETGPVRENFDALRTFAHNWHAIRRSVDDQQIRVGRARTAPSYARGAHTKLIHERDTDFNTRTYPSDDDCGAAAARLHHTTPANTAAADGSLQT